MWTSGSDCNEIDRETALTTTHCIVPNCAAPAVFPFPEALCKRTRLSPNRGYAPCCSTSTARSPPVCYPAITAERQSWRGLFGLPPLSIAEVKRHVGRGPEHLLGETCHVGDVRQNVAAYLAHHPSVLREGTRLLPGVYDTLRTLHEHGLRLAVCSNKPVAFTKQLVTILAIAEFFTLVLGPEDAGLPKPAPNILFAAALVPPTGPCTRGAVCRRHDCRYSDGASGGRDRVDCADRLRRDRRIACGTAGSPARTDVGPAHCRFVAARQSSNDSLVLLPLAVHLRGPKLGWLTAGYPNPPARKVRDRVFFFRGQAVTFSNGFGTLCGVLRRAGCWAEDLRCVGHRWACRELLRAQNAKQQEGRVIFIGHSAGGRYALFAAEQLQKCGVSVDLLVGLDVALPDPVPGNVKKAVHCYLSGLRRYPARPFTPAPRLERLVSKTSI